MSAGGAKCGGDETKAVVLVGHCGPDVYVMRTALSRVLSGVNIVTVNDVADLRPYLQPGSLLLVNRVLDGAFQSESGIDLIREIGSQSGPNDRPGMMLVSNFADAQEEAVVAGALPGFGKSSLYAPTTAERLRDAFGVA